MRTVVLSFGLTCLVALPAAARATCGGGGTSSLSFPAVTYVRSYRAPFGMPTRMAVDASGNVYVTDPGLGQIIVRAPSGRIISRAGGLGRPVSIAVGDAGRIYVGDAESGSVTAFNSDWQPILRLGRGAGEFSQPNDVAVDAATGNLYVADSTAHLVKVYSASGAFLQSFGGHGSDDGQFNFPVAVVVDAVRRQVLVADQLNYRIQAFDVAGTFLSCFGAQGSGAGQFNMPQGVSIDGHGRVYVADSVEGRVQVLDRNGDFIGYVGDFGEGRGQLRVPMAIVIDPSNRLFVTAANNARLEVFGLEAFADPETITPAVIHVEPDVIDRANPASLVAVYVEVPGYPLDQIVAGSIIANGVSASATPIIAGDHDSNGIPDAHVEFDRARLLATLPADGAGTVAVSGMIGRLQFEASAIVQITTCGPGTVCSLGSADPQCNEAVCIAPVGCTVQPKADGTGCEDGNACTVGDACSDGICIGTALSCDDGNGCTDDSCDPITGCVHADNSAPCDDGSACTVGDTCAGGACRGTVLVCDDDNACTDDTCDPITGCEHVNNTASCNDGNACTAGDACVGGLCSGTPVSCDDGNVCTDDTCDRASGCVHINTTASCDDGDPGTVRDTCDGAGSCVGQSVAPNYALLSWPLDSSGHEMASLMGQVRILGDVCAENIRVGPFSQIQGDAVAWTTDGRAIELRLGSQIAGNAVTGGGTLLGIDQVTVGGRIDVGGEAIELAECLAARYRATSRRADFIALPSSPGFVLGAIDLGPEASRRIPPAGELGRGQSVIDITDLRLGSASTLTLVGTPATEAVIVHIRGRMVLGRAARIAADGLPPERLIFVIDGSVVLRSQASIAGTVFAAGHVYMHSNSTISGAVLGGAIDLAPSATVDLHPFVKW